MGQRDIVVIGTSAGGLQALQTLFRTLPEGLPAAILVVMHRTQNSESLLPEILARHSTLPVVSPIDGEQIRKGCVYLAPAGVHTLVEGSRIRLVQGPRENRHRPAVDPLFRSAATQFGSRVIGVILTGMLDDGTSGLMVVNAHGGKAIVQNPRTAMFPAMPQNALNRVPDAVIASLEEIPAVLCQLISEPIAMAGSSEADDAAKESRIADMDMNEIENDARPGNPSEFACPECGGVLWEIQQRDLLRFRCRVGHAYTADHLDAAQRHAVESALWAGLRALEESLSLYKRLAARAHASDNAFTEKLYSDRAASTQSNARVLQQFLLNVAENSGTAAEDVEESA